MHPCPWLRARGQSLIAEYWLVEHSSTAWPKEIRHGDASGCIDSLHTAEHYGRRFSDVRLQQVEPSVVFLLV